MTGLGSLESDLSRLEVTHFANQNDLWGLAESGTLPPLGAYRTFQLPIADIGAMTDLGLAQLAAVDLLPTEPSLAPPPPGQAGAGWVELHSLEDVVIGP